MIDCKCISIDSSRRYLSLSNSSISIAQQVKQLTVRRQLTITFRGISIFRHIFWFPQICSFLRFGQIKFCMTKLFKNSLFVFVRCIYAWSFFFWNVSLSKNGARSEAPSVLNRPRLVKNKKQTALINILNLHIFLSCKTWRFVHTLYSFSEVTFEI